MHTDVTDVFTLAETAAKLLPMLAWLTMTGLGTQYHQSLGVTAVTRYLYMYAVLEVETYCSVSRT